LALWLLMFHDVCTIATRRRAMQGRHTAIPIAMPDHPRAPLLGWRRKQKTPGGLAKRARAMVRVADGDACAATARQVEWRERHGRTWARRVAASGLAGR
jgi:hypothetical protein